MRFSTALILLIVPAVAGARVPADLDDGWPTAAPTAVGLDGEAIAAIDRDLAAGRYPGIHSYLVIKDGVLVHEGYFEGASRDATHPIFSISKSVTAALVGIALGEGLLPGLDATLPELLPGLVDAMADPGTRAITLEHLLTLTAGWRWDEHSLPYGHEDNTHHIMTHSPSWVRAVLGLPLAHPPGERFTYNTGAVHVLGAILREATDRFAHRYCEEKLLAPLGIAEDAWSWNLDPEGNPAAGGTWGGLRLRSRDLAKFGALFLEAGNWRGRQILPAIWVRACLTPHADTGRGTQYGYLWWLGRLELKGRRLDYRYAAGYGGQSISLIPELRLMVVFTAASRPDDAPTFGPLLRTVAAALPATKENRP